MKTFKVKNYKGNLVESLSKFQKSHKGMKIVEAVEEGNDLKIKTELNSDFDDNMTKNDYFEILGFHSTGKTEKFGDKKLKEYVYSVKISGKKKDGELYAKDDDDAEFKIRMLYEPEIERNGKEIFDEYFNESKKINEASGKKVYVLVQANEPYVPEAVYTSIEAAKKDIKEKNSEDPKYPDEYTIFEFELDDLSYDNNKEIAKNIK